MSRDMVAIPAQELANLRSLVDRATTVEATTMLALLNIRGVLDLAMDHDAFGKLSFPAPIGAAVRICHGEAHAALKACGVIEDESDLAEAESSQD